jgi:hypothetical protein
MSLLVCRLMAIKDRYLSSTHLQNAPSLVRLFNGEPMANFAIMAACLSSV